MRQYVFGMYHNLHMGRLNLTCLKAGLFHMQSLHGMIAMTD
jgi:hypothetical protein